MATNTANPSIRPILDRIASILNDYIVAGAVLNPTGGTRPVRLIRTGWPIPGRIPYNLCPCIFVHAGQSEDKDEYLGQQMHRMTVTLSLIENILDTDMSVDHVYDYIDELRKLIFVTYRHWKRPSDASLSIVTTEPIGWSAAPVSEGQDHFLVQADITMTVVRQFDFY